MINEKIFKLPWEKPPMTLNKDYKRQQKWALKKQCRTGAHLTVQKWQPKPPPVQRIWVTMVWKTRRNGRRDEDNTVLTLKHIIDGIVDAGLIEDDTPKHVRKLMPIITTDPKHAGLYLHIFWEDGTPGPQTNPEEILEKRYPHELPTNRAR